MTIDINTLAEDRFDQSEEAGNDAEGAEDTNLNKGEGEEDGVQQDHESEEEDAEDKEEGSEEEDSSEEEGSEDDGSGDDAGEEDPKELSDEELLALAKKRGLDLKPKEEEKKEEEEKPADFKQPKELDDEVWGSMNPVQQEIYSELPYLNVRGKDSEGNELNLKIKTPEQLPEDFEFINKREEARFNSDLVAQSTRAEKAYSKISEGMAQNQQARQTQAESQRVVADVDKLVSDNIIPAVKAKYGTPEFNSDPAVALINKILVYREELKAEGDVVSVYRAGKMFKAENPDLFKDDKKSSGDGERKSVSKKVSGSGGAGSSKSSGSPKTKFAPGTNATDIADYYANDLD